MGSRSSPPVGERTSSQPSFASQPSKKRPATSTASWGVPSARQRSNVGVSATCRVPELGEHGVAGIRIAYPNRLAALDERAVVGDPHERLVEGVDLVPVRQAHDVADRAVPEHLRERELARAAGRLEVGHRPVRVVDPARVGREVAAADLRHVVGVEGEGADGCGSGEQDGSAERERGGAARLEREARREQ